MEEVISDSSVETRKTKAVQTIIDSYKPLAKVEELEEENYNMIDNIINNTTNKEEKLARRQGRKEWEQGRYANIRFEKKVENEHYNMIADMKLYTGEIKKEQLIAEFPNKDNAKDFCRQNHIVFIDATNYLKNRIKHKKYLLNVTSDGNQEFVSNVGKKRGLGEDIHDGNL